MHLISALMFFFGANLPAINIRNKKLQHGIFLITPTKMFFVYCYLLILFGLMISIIQLTSFLSLRDYFSMLLTNDNSLADLRSESASGGLSGILKIFAYAPLSIYLTSEGILTFLQINEIDRIKILRIRNIALMASLIKVFIWLDRLTLLAIIITRAYIYINSKKIFLKRIFLILPFIVFILLIGNYISSRRLEGYDVFDFIILYTKLGLVNFELMIKSVDHFTYGFNSILSPFNFIFDFFGINFNINSTFQYIWNPAQYMNSYLYQDFGYFSLLVYFIMGWFAKNIDYWKNSLNIRYGSLFFTFLFAFSTFWFVPIIRAVEFWLMLLIPLFSLKYISFHKCE